eukprot:CAMPEP_0195519864 /NCGR_PEP_ID=MMETSP0794_2-20130614/15655_1 /TAXON_ID=515487 /ORGANISM="Stephanopyxis turris, Strain CCMP 815" /LENGTH=585 /DNA_ID=CAMNT_0040649095 /DNA_START=332 /DNA_END=2090 /DNA_ORIENTATION=+
MFLSSFNGSYKSPENGYSTSKKRAASTLIHSTDSSTAHKNDAAIHVEQHPSKLKPNFNDPKSAHGTKSTKEILRAILVFQLCRIKPLVSNAESLLCWSNRIVGKTFTDFLLKQTFFSHFCAGENANDIRAVVQSLRSNGIENILDYAAESEHAEEEKEHDEDNWMTMKQRSMSIHESDTYSSSKGNNQPARIYDYQSEAKCDEHLAVFLSCIRAVRDVSPDRGVAAVKVTALGNPLLLERMSTAICEARNLFQRFDTDNDGIVSRDEFEVGYRSIFYDADKKITSLLKRLDPQNTNKIDYISWSKLLSPKDLPRLTSKCRKIGPLSIATPSDEEILLLEALHNRAHILCAEAAKYQTRLLFDAEQSYYQPAIDNLVLELMETYNSVTKTSIPIVFHTYQCYLRDTHKRLRLDVERSYRFNYHFAAKLVRGAYMVGERERAMTMGYDSPIHDSIQETHDCYNDAMDYLLRQKQNREHNISSSGLQVMCATHNQESIEKTINLMKDLNIPNNSSTVHFAQLLGMSDHLTFTLGKHGYLAYKYVPYGEVNEVIPYLLRRAQENSDMLGNANNELELLYGELKGRLIGF